MLFSFLDEILSTSRGQKDNCANEKKLQTFCPSSNFVSSSFGQKREKIIFKSFDFHSSHA